MRLLVSQNEGKTLRIEIRLSGCCGDWMYQVRIVNRFTGELYIQFEDCGDSEFIALKEAQKITRKIMEENPEA